MLWQASTTHTRRHRGGGSIWCGVGGGGKIEVGAVCAGPSYGSVRWRGLRAVRTRPRRPVRVLWAASVPTVQVTVCGCVYWLGRPLAEEMVPAGHDRGPRGEREQQSSAAALYASDSEELPVSRWVVCKRPCLVPACRLPVLRPALLKTSLDPRSSKVSPSAIFGLPARLVLQQGEVLSVQPR